MSPCSPLTNNQAERKRPASEASGSKSLSSRLLRAALTRGPPNICDDHSFPPEPPDGKSPPSRFFIPQLSESVSSGNPLHDSITQFLEPPLCLGNPELFNFFWRFCGFL